MRMEWGIVAEKVETNGGKLNIYNVHFRIEFIDFPAKMEGMGFASLIKIEPHEVGNENLLLIRLCDPDGNIIFESSGVDVKGADGIFPDLFVCLWKNFDAFEFKSPGTYRVEVSDSLGFAAKIPFAVVPLT